MDQINLTSNNYDLYAAKMYNNPECVDTEEFNEDLAKIKYIKRLFNRYTNDGDLKSRLIINHFVVLFNVFGIIPTTRLLFLRLPEHHDLIKTVLIFFNQCPVEVEIDDGKTVNVSQINFVPEVLSKLKEDI